MAKAPKKPAKSDAPPVVSTLPPPEPVKRKRKRALPDDIPRGSLPAPKRKVAQAKAPAKPARKPRSMGKPDLAKQAELEPMPHGGALKRSTAEKPDPRETPPTKTGAPVEKVEAEPRPPMSDILFRSICLEISEGVPLRQICRRAGMPSKTAFYEFLDGADLDGEDPSAPDVRSGRLARYARARKLGYDALAEESLEIADDGTNDWVEREKEDGRLDVEVDRDHIQRSKLRIETRLKLLAVWDPKRYGQMIKVGDPDAKPMDQGGKSASDIAIGMAKLLAAAQREQGAEA